MYTDILSSNLAAWQPAGPSHALVHVDACTRTVQCVHARAFTQYMYMYMYVYR